MNSILKRIIAGGIAIATSLAAVVSTLPNDVTISQIPLISWLIAVLSGLTGFYSPNSVVKEDLEEFKPVPRPTEEPKP